MSQPSEVAFQILNRQIYKVPIYTAREKLSIIDSITLADIAKRINNETKTKVLVTGNLNQNIFKVWKGLEPCSNSARNPAQALSPAPVVP